jgi:hypothetical protein
VDAKIIACPVNTGDRLHNRKTKPKAIKRIMKKLMKKLILTSVIMLAIATGIIAQKNDFPELTGPYLGQTPPVNEPILFAPGIVSISNHSSVAISPDGKELYWCRNEKIWFTKMENGIWTKPEMLSLCKGDPYLYDNPFITTDGKRMFFTSFRPGAVSKDKETIWYVERIPSGWSDPVPVSKEVNMMPLHWSISVSDSGTLYFDGGDICYSKLVNGLYTKPVRLGPEINTRYIETCPYIAPDESYILFVRLYETPKNSGIYISYRDKSGKWLTPVMVIGGDPETGGVSPRISPDGKYLFFANGSAGMWWMPAGFIDELQGVE